MSLFCDEKEQKRRRSICEKCEHKQGVRCGLCGCFLLGISKWKPKECPAGKFEIKNGENE